MDSNSLIEMLIHTEPKSSVYDSYTATVLITKNTGHSVRHVAENSYTQTSKCSQQKFTNQLYKQCVCIYTKAPTSNMAKYRPQHGKSAPEFLNYSARVHLACHRIPDPPLVKPLTPASGVLCMTQVTQHRINYRKNDQKASLGGQSSDF